MKRVLALASLSSVVVVFGIVSAATPSVAVTPPLAVTLSISGPTVRSPLAWGDNISGQLGDGTSAGRNAPVQPFGLGSGVSQVAAGDGHTLAVRESGTVLAWGRNSHGQLGDGTLVDHLIPLPVSTLTGVARVSAGRSHSVALRSDGTVWAWGDNSQGQLGNGTTKDRRRPVQVSILTGITDISAGSEFNLARRLDGTVWAWGDNSQGQLGDGTRTDRLRPVRVLTLANVVQVAAGLRHSMALRSDGVAFGWGENDDGEVGDGTAISRTVPGRVTLLGAVTQVAAGNGFTVAVSNGRPHWWGLDCHQVGRDTALCSRDNVPVAHPVNLTGVVKVATGTWHTVAIRSDGTLWAWGSNFLGQLGDGSNTLRIDPVRIAAATGSLQVDAGGEHTVVVVERPVVTGP